MTIWTPAVVCIDNVDAYGPYRAEIDHAHSRANVYERPRFCRQAAQQLIEDHQAVIRGQDLDATLTVEWDGDDIVVTNGPRYGSGEPGLIERITPDQDGRYPMLSDWQWELHAPDEDQAAPAY